MKRLCATGLLLASLSAAAFDTAEDHHTPWHSAYLKQEMLPGKSRIHNEHTVLSDTALTAIGARDQLGIGGSLRIRVVDLNASLFKTGGEQDLYLLESWGDAPETDLEERLLPSPAQFSGLPDYSYTLYDWINKNRICPVKPPDNIDLCHTFQGWMGALNANHFGTQAKLTYHHLHGLAMELARRARTAREDAIAQSGQATLPYYRDRLLEMEAMAYIYEGIAQHFLQDRWSTGHMWERWNGSDTDNIYGALWLDLLVGIVSGLIHGAESVTHPVYEGMTDPAGLTSNRDAPFLDMLSSPRLLQDGHEPAQWRFSGDETRYEGVGDKRFLDMKTGDYAGHPLKVTDQLSVMMTCLGSSWAEVIREVGKLPGSTTYGVASVTLNAHAPNEHPADPDSLCTDAWVTNDSIYIAWLDDFLVGLARTAFDRDEEISMSAGELARFAIQIGGRSAKEAENTSRMARHEFVRLSKLLETRRMIDRLKHESGHDTPVSISLAQGGMGSLATRKPGAFYPLANWYEPQDLSALPDEDTSTGRDKQTLFGFFSRAGLDHWCANPDKVFNQTSNALPGQVGLEACLHLAGQMYQGTSADAAGQSREEVTVDGRPASLPVTSACRIEQPDRELAPIVLSPGYIRFDPADPTAGPYEKTFGTYRSVFNWCRGLPVLDYTDDKNHPDRVTLGRPSDTLEISGMNLDKAPGTLEFEAWMNGHNVGSFSLKPDTWTENRLTVTLPPTTPPGEYCIRVHRADGITSEGRFVLKIESHRKPSGEGEPLHIGAAHRMSAHFMGQSAELAVLPETGFRCPTP